MNAVNRNHPTELGGHQNIVPQQRIRARIPAQILCPCDRDLLERIYQKLGGAEAADKDCRV